VAAKEHKERKACEGLENRAFLCDPCDLLRQAVRPPLTGSPLWDSIRRVKRFQAIAAMSLNRVIGAGNRIPWHLPEDFRWFKQMTTGQVIIMGRKTFESIGKPLPNRTTIVLTRRPIGIPGVLMAFGLDKIDFEHPSVAGRKLFICGGAQVYEQALPLCSGLYLTLVQRVVDGDAFFPAFEKQYELAEELMDRPEFKILHYRNRNS
jgi:dihydrofolate reductase